jgi:uncharacterized flavoprotein (TIGR03862 family)
MAAQVLSHAGTQVHVFDAMATAGRKFLLAGKGGLNLTHSETLDVFVARYGERHSQMASLLADFDPQQMRAWAADLGAETFVGSSGRVFPADLKAAPLLRSWLHRLRHPVQHGPAPLEQNAPGVKGVQGLTGIGSTQRMTGACGGHGVQFHMRQRWRGWDDSGALLFAQGAQWLRVRARAVVLAMGGGSWARLGSDGAWVQILAQRGVEVAPLQPSNCGFDVKNGWSALFRDKFAGQPFKSVALSIAPTEGPAFARKGEFVATQTGVEGSLIYAVSALLRDEIARTGQATFLLDLLPDHTDAQVLAQVSHPRGSRSLTSHLKSRLHLEGIKTSVLYELLGPTGMQEPNRLAHAIKALPVTVTAARPIDEAISSAGGVRFEALTPDLMLRSLPGVFCAGEMLDWEAPTGGYLLQGVMASGMRAGRGALNYLARLPTALPQ